MLIFCVLRFTRQSRADARTHTHTHTCTNTYTYAHTHTHTHNHCRVRVRKPHSFLQRNQGRGVCVCVCVWCVRVCMYLCVDFGDPHHPRNSACARKIFYLAFPSNKNGSGASGPAPGSAGWLSKQQERGMGATILRC